MLDRIHGPTRKPDLQYSKDSLYTMTVLVEFLDQCGIRKSSIGDFSPSMLSSKPLGPRLLKSFYRIFDVMLLPTDHTLVVFLTIGVIQQ